MISSVTSKTIQQILSASINSSVGSIQFNAVDGGSINDTYQIIINKDQKLFCKINSAIQFPLLFEKEKNGLALLNSHNIINTPKIIACQTTDDTQILILEWVEQASKTEKFWKLFGEQLAKLHSITMSGGGREAAFGLDEDNYMGAFPQSNTLSNNWTDFFIHQRLEPQIKSATDNFLLGAKYLKHFNNLYKILLDIFPDEPSSLLHGDLWSGNFLCNITNEPVLIDPAIYFGHRSMDLGMTTIFGSFDKSFYESYHYHFPFPDNYRQQWDTCNLYPLLVHLNLFGKSYLSGIVRIIERF
jgi:protein-ribulosamine 3-kinase